MARIDAAAPTPTKRGPYEKRQPDMHMDGLTWFGLFAVSAMLLCYAMENRSRWWILAFAFSCIAGSAYGFMQGAWPFGLVEGIWSIVAFRRWWQVNST
ncbi:hypothetical protein [Sphingomonas psychrolutea]|uniref:hypothetical protein n=1 Tax=Sphingomonas psychrolutea TaxID=1259676 RepID=UPI00403B32CA